MVLPALEFIIAPHYDMNKAGIYSITSSSAQSHPPFSNLFHRHSALEVFLRLNPFWMRSLYETHL